MRKPRFRAAECAVQSLPAQTRGGRIQDLEEDSLLKHSPRRSGWGLAYKITLGTLAYLGKSPGVSWRSDQKKP